MRALSSLPFSSRLAISLRCATLRLAFFFRSMSMRVTVAGMRLVRVVAVSCSGVLVTGQLELHL